MRLEFGFQLSDVEVPRFSVEAVEGIGKLFTLATLLSPEIPMTVSPLSLYFS